MGGGGCLEQVGIRLTQLSTVLKVEDELGNKLPVYQDFLTFFGLWSQKTSLDNVIANNYARKYSSVHRRIKMIISKYGNPHMKGLRDHS